METDETIQPNGPHDRAPNETGGEPPAAKAKSALEIDLDPRLAIIYELALQRFRESQAASGAGETPGP